MVERNVLIKFDIYYVIKKNQIHNVGRYNTIIMVYYND